MLWISEFFNGSFSQEEMRRAEMWARQDQQKPIKRVLSRSGGRIMRGLFAIGHPVRVVFRKARRSHRKRITIRELDALSDRSLRDIGVHRNDIHSLAAAAADGILYD